MLLALLMYMGLQAINAQTTISGVVTGASDGAPVPGATVVAKGVAGVGTITDMDGKFSLKVPANVNILTVSFVGMKSQDVDITGKSTVNVALQSGDVSLNDVVVTAIGIKRDEKSLGYSATKVSSDDLKSKGTSMMNSLQGKIAGVNISSASSGPGGSTKVILRGYSSLSGNNQPLYVVDGVPIDNNSASDSETQGVDFGNRANDINPDDIESMTILRGAAATALYGSRAASGVVMITTKSGKDTKNKINVELSSTTSISNVLRTPQLQNTFGQGWSGHFAYEENGSWGPKFDGKMRLWGTNVDNSRQLKPYVGLSSNMKDFYENGLSLNNSVALSGGNDKASFYASFANITDDGILPTDQDYSKKNSMSLRGSVKGQKLNVSASFNYVKKDVSSIADGNGGQTNSSPTMYEELLQIPRDISIVDLKDYNNKFNNLDNYFTVYANNPYYVLANNKNLYNENRAFGNVSLDYKVNSWITAVWRLGADIADYTSKFTESQFTFREGGFSQTWGKKGNPGWVVEGYGRNQELNSDFLLRFNPKVSEDFTVSGLLGWNLNARKSKVGEMKVTDLEVPDYYSIKNTTGTPIATTTEKQKRITGVYGQADFSYKNYAFLSLTARNDWSSTLPKNHNSYFYPSANFSYVLSDAIPEIKTILPYSKVRASWGMNGKDTDPYKISRSIIPSYVGTSIDNSLKFPINGTNAYEISDVLGNDKLKPEISTEYEFGCDLRFLNNRVGIDFAYYVKTTKDQIYDVPIAATSGYRRQVKNFGTVENKGIELALNLVPIKMGDFRWDFTCTFSNNRNKVLELTDGLDEVELTKAYDVRFVAMKGYPLGVFKGPVAATTADGKTIVNASGFPVAASETGVWGTAEPKYMLGFNNTFSYKGFTLGVVVDSRQGGLMYSGTSDLSIFVGNSTLTTYNERQPFIVPNSVKEVEYTVMENGVPKKLTRYEENDIPMDMTNVSSYYYHTANKLAHRMRVIDRSYVKLRELSLTYKLPRKFFGKLPIDGVDLSVIGRNLLLWTPSDNNMVDPENSSYGNDLNGEFGEFRTGGTSRTISFAVKVRL